jgi:tetratricopeptide (TPR) repeat protein
MKLYRLRLAPLCALLGLFPAAAAPAPDVPLVQRQWFETRTAHFNVFSCGEPQQVFKVAAQFEQFCEAYSQLAGTAAVASPPIVVMAFPDHESLKPFLPLYHGQPENLAGFFNHGTDENLIVLALPGRGGEALQLNVIFHEYTHLLLRRNDRIWPLWLKEGMAEIYSTFQTTGYYADIALPIEHHLELLRSQPLMPLKELFAVGHDSPAYNERTLQGMFYAESWLLTHYLMAGDNPVLKERFKQFTPRLHAGEVPLQAFTNALQVPLPALEKELRRYLDRGQFNGISFALPDNVATPKGFATRWLTPVENYFRLGDELLRIGRVDDAKRMFANAQALAPASPLPYEGLGLIAAQREQTDEALRQLQVAIQRGSGSFLAYFLHAWQLYHQAANHPDDPSRLPKAVADEIHADLMHSLTLMPDFGPAHELFGIVELSSGGQVALAEQHLQLAAQLEPENPFYQLALADVEVENHETDAARRTLDALILPNVEAKVREQAGELLKKLP